MMVLNGVVLSLLERAKPASPAPPGDRAYHVRSNLVLTALLIVLNFALDRMAGAAGIAPRPGELGLLNRTGLPAGAKILVVVVVLDGLAYLAHLLMHQLPPAWRFHRVHHSDAHVDVTTAFRQHPLETVWRYSFLFAGAAVLGASPTSVAVYLALSALNAQLEHAHVSLPWRVDRLLRLVISTPAMHRVHHSRSSNETDTNFS